MAGPSEAFAAHMKELRQVRGWTTQQLSERLAELGVDVHPTAVTKIEKGTRGISLDEAVAIAVAFNVPLDMLYLPLDAETFDITPAMQVSPWAVLSWVLDERPLVFSDVAGWRDWTEAAYELHKQHQATRKRVEAARVEQHRANFQSDDQRRAAADDAYAEALEAVAAAWRATERHGFVPPRLPAEWVDHMTRLGIEPPETWRGDDDGQG